MSSLRGNLDDDGERESGSKLVRPDEMEQELLAFVAGIDAARRELGRSHLTPGEILGVAKALGYRGPKGVGVKALESAIANYRQQQKRLFPNWSEIFGLLLELGYRRPAA